VPQTTAESPWLKYTSGKKPLMYVDTYAQYVQCGYVYLDSAAALADHKDGAQRIRVELLPLLRLRFGDSHSNHHNLTKLQSWVLHCANPVARLGKMATFFPVGRTIYVKRANNHSAGLLAQYMMTKLKWKVFAFQTEVPQARATEAEALAVPMHSWFKTRP